MHILTILILSSLVTAEIFDLFKRYACDTASCFRGGEILNQYCEHNDKFYLRCMCEEIPDAYYENVYVCNVGCGGTALIDFPNPSEIRQGFCLSVALADRANGLSEAGNFTEAVSDSGTENTAIESVSRTAISDSKTVESISTNSGTTTSKTSSAETSSTEASSSEASSTEASSTEASSIEPSSSESATIVNGAGIMNNGLFSSIALMIVMLI